LFLPSRPEAVLFELREVGGLDISVGEIGKYRILQRLLGALKIMHALDS